MVDILKRVEELSDLFDNKGSERLEFNSGGRIGFSTAGLVKNLLKKIPVRTGKERTQKIKDLTPYENFMKEFLEYAQKKFKR